MTTISLDRKGIRRRPEAELTEQCSTTELPAHLWANDTITGAYYVSE